MILEKIDFKQFIFYDTEMGGLISHDTEWPTEVLYEERRTFLSTQPDFSTEAGKFKQKEIYFRSVKNIMKESGERANELYFRKKEFDQKLINIKFSKYPLAFMSLIASKWFSRHGTNWLIPIIFLLIFNCYFGTVFHFLSGGEFDITGFFQLMNPAHKVESLGVDMFTVNNPLFLSIDYLSRVVSSYLIFQTIKSFRTFV